MSGLHDSDNHSSSKVKDAGDFLLQLTYLYARQADESPVAGAFILHNDSEQQDGKAAFPKRQKFLIFEPLSDAGGPTPGYVLYFHHQRKWNVIFISIRLKIVFLYSFVNGDQVHMIKHLAKTSLIFAQVNDILKSAMSESCCPLQPNRGPGSRTDESGATEKHKYLLKVFDLSRQQDGRGRNNSSFADSRNLLRLVYLLVRDAVGLGSQLTINGVGEMFDHVVWEDLFGTQKSKQILVPPASCLTIKTFRLDGGSTAANFRPGQDLIFFCYFAQSAPFEEPLSGGRYYFDPQCCEPLLLRGAAVEGVSLVPALFFSNMDFDLLLQCYAQFQARSPSVELSPVLVASMLGKLRVATDHRAVRLLFDSLGIPRMLDYLFDERNADQNRQYHLGSVFPLMALPPIGTVRKNTHTSSKAPRDPPSIISERGNALQQQIKPRQASVPEIPTKRSPESAFVSASETGAESRSVSMPDLKRQKTTATPTGAKAGGGDDDGSDSGSDSDILEISDGEFTGLRAQQRVPEAAAVRFSASPREGRRTRKESGNSFGKSDGPAGSENVNDDVFDSVFDDTLVHAPSATSASTASAIDCQNVAGLGGDDDGDDDRLEFSDKTLEYFADMGNFVLPQRQQLGQHEAAAAPALSDDDQLIATLRRELYSQGAWQKFASADTAPQAWDAVVAALEKKILLVETESRALDAKAKQLQQDISREAGLQVEKLRTRAAGMDVRFAKEINEYKHAILKEQLNIERLLFEKSKAKVRAAE